VYDVTGKGIPEIKHAIQIELNDLAQKNRNGSFRLPIDQVFTVQGHGTVIRGTIFEGSVTKEQLLTLLPSGKKVRIRQIQVHNQVTEKAQAGQRTALNITGVSKEEIKRGDVLVDSENYQVTNTIDVSLQLVTKLAMPLKQRSPVKLHVGTKESYGKIVFFDRNVLDGSENEILCQIRLDEEIVVRRGDRFILRRPTPVETIGGGWIIQPLGGKYRFGVETITMLRMQMESSPSEVIDNLLHRYTLLSKLELIRLSSLPEGTVAEILSTGKYLKIFNSGYCTTRTVSALKEDVLHTLMVYHKDFPLRIGMSKAELIQALHQDKNILDFCLDELIKNQEIKKEDQYLSLSNFQPNLASGHMKKIVSSLLHDGVQPKKWTEYIKEAALTNRDSNELKTYLIKTKQAFLLNDETLIHKHAFEYTVNRLRANTKEQFSLSEAKDILNLSRKYLIPFLELLDLLNL